MPVQKSPLNQIEIRVLIIGDNIFLIFIFNAMIKIAIISNLKIAIRESPFWGSTIKPKRIHANKQINYEYLFVLCA